MTALSGPYESSRFKVDIFEHAYAIDDGPNEAPYLGAFFKSVRWAEVARGFEAALARA